MLCTALNRSLSVHRFAFWVYYGLNWVSQRMLESTAPFVSMILLGNRVFADEQIKMRLLEGTLIQNDYVLIKGGNLGREREKRMWSKMQRMSCITSQGMPERGYKELGEKLKRFTLIALRRNQPCQHAHLELLASKIVKQFCISYLVYGTRCVERQPWKTNPGLILLLQLSHSPQPYV